MYGGLVCMCVCTYVCMYVPHVCAVSAEVKERLESPGIGVTDNWEQTRGARNQTTALEEHHPMLFPAEPSLQPLF